MPTVRRPLKHNALPRITDQVVRLFVRIEEIRAMDGWEDDPALHRECYRLWGEFDTALHIYPFEHNPIAVPSDGPLLPGLRDLWHSWDKAQELRRALEAAVRERRRTAAEAAGAPEGRL